MTERASQKDEMNWNARYRSGEVPTTPSPFVVDVVRDLPPARALDLACGAGRHAHWLAARGWDVVAIDNSEEALAQVRVPKLRLDLEREPLPFDDAAFDLVLIIRFLHPPLFDEAERVLKPGGVLVAEVNTTGTFAIDPQEVEARFATWERVGQAATARAFAFAARRPGD